jgi:hypothetical protein
LCNGWAERKYELFRGLRFLFVPVWGRCVILPAGSGGVPG